MFACGVFRVFDHFVLISSLDVGFGRRSCVVVGCPGGGRGLGEWAKQTCSLHAYLNGTHNCECEPPFKLFPFPTEKKGSEGKRRWTENIKIWQGNGSNCYGLLPLDLQKNHKDVKYRECGQFIHETKQLLGASPDLLVKCSCCGKGILEVKCSFCIANDIPTDLNLDYLVKMNDEVTLKRKYSYYTQVQGQFGVTKREWCHFLVYTKKGYHLDRIQLDKDYWLTLVDSLDWFYVNHLKPASK